MADMSTMAVAKHPAPWQRPVRPADVAEGRLEWVAGGALACGVRADAVVEVDAVEFARRGAVGAGAVASLPLLDVLMNLPLGCPVGLGDLSGRERRLLAAAPQGCVTFSAGTVERVVRVPVTVVAAVIHAPRWGVGAKRTVAFAPLTQRVVVLPRLPRDQALWEARYLGVGVWVSGAHGTWREVLAPEPLSPRYFKAAGWRFAENAYRRLATAGAA